MNFFDMSRERKGILSGLWPVRRRALLVGVGVLAGGTVAALTVSVSLGALRSAPPESVAAAPVVPLSLPRPLLAQPDDGAALMAAVAALRPDPVIVRGEPMAFARRPVLAAPVTMTVSSKAAATTQASPVAANPAALIVAALPLPAADLAASPTPEAFAVQAQAPLAETARPLTRPVVIAALAAPVRPVPRPTQLAAAPQTLRPAPRPAATPLVASTAAPAHPAPRPFEAASTALATAQAPLLLQPVPAEPAAVSLAVTSAPEATPMPQSRPARVLLAAAAARATRPATAVPTAAAPAVQTVALREPVAPPSGALAEALAAAPEAADCRSRLARDIPRRPGSAASGSEFGAALANVSGTERDRMIVREVLSGNVPQFLRTLTPVSLSGTSTAGKPVTITVCVTPDYVAVGDNDDFLRLPMGLPEAAQIADSFGFMLPTTRIVDAIYAQAAVRLTPRPMQAGPEMTSTSYLRQHNATIEGQGDAAGLRSGALVAGIKKDLVLTNALRRAPGQVAIYGWHQSNGRPIQPLTTVHGRHYSDYSHGVRLVSQTAYVNGRAVALADLLEDRTYAAILSNEGPIAQPRLLLASLWGR